MGRPDSPSAAFPLLRRRLRRMVLFRGLSRLVCVFILAVNLVGGLDWWLRFDSHQARIVASSSIAVVLATLLLSSVVLPLWRRLSDHDLAVLVERARPDLRGALSSSVEFSNRGCDPASGAPALQRVLIQRTTRRAAGMEIASLLDPKSVSRAAASALLCCLAAATIIAVAPAHALTAMQRLAVPHRQVPWPRQNTLVLLDADFEHFENPGKARTVSSAEPLVLYVVDRDGRMPDDVTLHTLIDNHVLSRPLESTEIVDHEGRRRQAFMANVPPKAGSIRIRATGGDDQRMPWHEFRRLAPPTLEDLRIAITPPDYSGQSVVTRDRLAGRFTALVGSEVRVQARSPQRLDTVNLRNDANEATTLDAVDRQYESVFTVREPGVRTYWFDLADARGMTASSVSRFEVEAVEDTVPFVAVRSPPADLSVTPSAVVPVAVTARDDVGVTQVRLRFSHPSGSVEQESVALPGLDAPLRSAELSSEIAVADFDLAAGHQLAFHAEADDAFDLGPRHTAESRRYVLTVVSPDDKLDELISKQSQIGEQLQRVADRQTRALRHTRDLMVQWRTAKALAPEDMGLLRRVNVDQKRITTEIEGGQSSVIEQSAAVLDELAWNQFADQPITRRLSQFVADVRGLDNELADVQQSLGRALRAVETDGADDVEPALARIETSQARILETLQQSLTRFETWQLHHDVARRFDELSTEQQGISEGTVVIGRKTLARRYSDLALQEQADLARLAARQQQLTTDINQFTTQCETLAALGQSSGLVDANTLTAVIRLLDTEDVAGMTATASRLVDQNRIADAVETQRAIMQVLEHVERLLRNTGEESPELLLRQITEAQEEVEHLRTRQQRLAERTSAAASDISRDELLELRKQQVELARDAQESAQRLLQRQIGKAGTSASRAADAMQAAADGLQDEVSPSAIADQRDAVDDLLQAERELNRLRHSLDAGRVSARLAELGQDAQAYRTRQQRLTDETARLEEALREQGRLSRSELRSLRQLATDQRSLSEDVASNGTGITEGADVFHMAFQMAAQHMADAAGRLDERTTDEATQNAQAAAMQFLDQIADVSAMKPPQSNDAVPTTADSSDETAESVDTSLIPQLELLLNMQRGLAERTAALMSVQETQGALTVDEQEELALLAARQAQLKSLAADILSESTNEVDGDRSNSENSP